MTGAKTPENAQSSAWLSKCLFLSSLPQDMSSLPFCIFSSISCGDSSRQNQVTSWEEGIAELPLWAPGSQTPPHPQMPLTSQSEAHLELIGQVVLGSVLLGNERARQPCLGGWEGLPTIP